MISYLKSKFLEQPEKLIEYLEHFGYCHVNKHQSYISFARDDNKDSSPTGISLYLSENLICKDYSRAITLDLFNLVIRHRKINFKEAITTAKDILGIERGWHPEQRPNVAFGGFYSNLKRKKECKITIYDDSVLDNYKNYGNLRFLRDGINLNVQREFNIGFSIADQAITIPIFSETGEIMGMKMRTNLEIQDGMQKYWYDDNYKCQVSQTLYGFSHNYQYLESGDVFIFEAEKSVLQGRSFNFNQAVGMASSSLSKKQCQMILSLNPKRVILMHDEGIAPKVVYRNIQALRTYGKMKEFEILYWASELDESIPKKASASDLGEEKFMEIIAEQLVVYNEEEFIEKYKLEDEI